MFSFIDHVESRHGAHVLLPWEEKPIQRRSLPERLQLSLPATESPLVTVSPARSESRKRAAGGLGWLARLFERPVLRRAAF